MATTPPDLAKLLGALRGARDPWTRLRLVAGGARQLARLTQRERRELLRKVGLEGAEELADLASGGDPEAIAAVEHVLRSLEENPQQLQRFVRDVSEPKSRRATLAGLAAHVLEVVTAPPPNAAPPPPPPAPAESAAGHSATGAPGSAGALGSAASREARRSGAAAAKAARPARPAASPRVAPAPGAPAGSAPPPAPPAAAAAAAPPAGVAASPGSAPTDVPGEGPARHGELTATPSPAGALPAPRGSEPPPPPSLHPGGRDGTVRSAGPRRDATVEATAARTTLAASRDTGGTTSGPLAALQALREQLATGAPPAREAFVAILERELPQDWARRRALAALFASGLPPRADEALDLVGRLATAASRRWALSDLAASRPWADDDFARLVAAADTPALRRRLASRRPAG